MSDSPDPVTRVAVINDFEVVVRGVLGMLEPFRDQVQVVELDVDRPVGVPVDVALYDAFTMEGTHTDAIDDIVADPHVAALVIYTWANGPEVVEEALARDVRGVLSKTLPAAELVDALRRVHVGEVVLSPPPTEEDPVVPGDWPGRAEGLTGREAEVVALITLGLSNAEIAERSYLSINSVKSYIRSAYRRMGVSTRSQAVRWGLEHGVHREPVRLRVAPVPQSPTPTPAPPAHGSPAHASPADPPRDEALLPTAT